VEATGQKLVRRAFAGFLADFSDIPLPIIISGHERHRRGGALSIQHLVLKNFRHTGCTQYVRQRHPEAIADTAAYRRAVRFMHSNP
jgi:hypothetical protein